MGKQDDAPHVEVTSRAEWRAWLTRHHATSDGVWLVTFKRASGGPHLPYPDVVEEALCFGWVDSTSGSVDDRRSRLWLAPRKKGSGWARTNKERVERLTAEGLMTPAGLAAVERAIADGTWTALDSVEALEVPNDLIAALDSVADARRHWDAFPPGERKRILQWIATAKRPQTRAARVEETARLAGENVRANLWRKPN